jgi:hypothetical protein
MATTVSEGPLPLAVFTDHCTHQTTALLVVFKTFPYEFLSTAQSTKNRLILTTLAFIASFVIAQVKERALPLTMGIRTVYHQVFYFTIQVLVIKSTTVKYSTTLWTLPILFMA